MIHNLQALMQNQYLWICYTNIHFAIEYLYMISILHVWLIDRLTNCINKRINQLIYGWKTILYLCSKYQFKYYFQNQRICILLLGYHMFSYIFNQSFTHVFDSCMNDWRIGSMPIVQAIFIISLTNNNANNNIIVNEYQNRWLIMKINICVQKQCLEQKWNEMMSSNSNKKEWMNDNMSSNTNQ